MSISPFLPIAFIVVTIWNGLFERKLPRNYRNRKCQGRSWKNSFPESSKQDIREFLEIAAYSFGFNVNEKLKLRPEDAIFEIYKAYYPWGGTDQLELETLATKMERRYGVNLYKIWREELTLGHLFLISSEAREHQAT